MQVQIIPKWINPPKKPGGKWGNVKDASGNVLWVPVPYLNHFQEGQPINVVTKTSDRPWGTLGHVEQIVNINGQDVTGQQGPVQAGDRPAPIPQNVPKDDKEEGMFIMGVVGRAMGSGQFGVTDILDLTQAAALAWRERHIKPEPQQTAQPPANVADELGFDPDDSIPF